MIELRWLKKKYDVTQDGEVKDSYEAKVLQYRTLEIKVGKLDSFPRWNDYQDIPVVEEE